MIDFKSDDYTSAVAKNIQEAQKLIESGSEYVRFSDKDKVAIYRKSK